MWSDILNYWQYLAALFIYCVLLVLPIYININILASSITRPVYQLLHLAWFYYVISTLLNLTFLYNTVNPYYLILYMVWIILFGIFNPYKIITTIFPMLFNFFMTLLLVILLYFFKKEFLTTFFIFLLTITLQMVLFSFSNKPTFLFLGVIGIYLLGGYLFFNPVTLPETGPGTGPAAPPVTFLSRFQNFFLYFYNLSTIHKSGVFLLITGIMLYLFIRDVTKNYYGGQFLVNDPISLDQITTFPIESTYHSSMSCWVYLTPSSSSEYNTIFLYGEKILVSFEADVNSLRIRLKDDISYIERKILLQKWNHIAFVYDHGRIIFYLNGDLIHSSEWAAESFTNEILFGKIKGEVCHVRYYKEPLDERFIQSLYDNFKNKNPPIV